MDINKNNKYLIIVAILSSFITTFMGSALNLSIPNIQSEFSISTATVGWIVNSYMLTCAVLAVPFGFLGDWFNKKILLCAGLFIFAGSSATGLLAKNIAILILIRALQGVGASMIFSSNIAILVENSSEEQKGKNLGLATGANYLGLSAGPIIGGYLNYYFGWKGVFFISAIIAGVAFVITLIKLPRTDRKDEPNKRGSKKWDYMSLIRNKAYISANLAAFINYGGTFAVGYILSIYLQNTRGFSSKNAGLILVIAPIIQTVISWMVGKLSDKFAPQKISAIGMVICAVSLLALSYINIETSLYYIMICIAVNGLGSGIFSSPNTNAVMSSVNKEHYGVASAALATMRSLGHTASTSLIMAIGNNQVCFLLFAVATIGGIFMALQQKT